jgi:membrane-associated phospholipid phosphatase
VEVVVQHRSAIIAGGRRWQLDALWQLTVAAGGYIAYSLSVGAVQWAGALKSRESLAIANAGHIIDLERGLGVFRERDLQTLIVNNDVVMQVFNAIYMWAHLPLIIAIAIWLYVRHRPHFRVTRNAVLISGAIALIVFQIFPVAPPRLVPGLGFVDTAARVSGVYDTVEPKAFFNPYAAVPSMHVGWVLLMGLTVWRYAGYRRIAWLGLALPVLMAVAVVVTGNHWVFDPASGVLAAIAGLGLALFAERRLYRDRAAAGPARLEPAAIALGLPSRAAEAMTVDVQPDTRTAGRLRPGGAHPPARD